MPQTATETVEQISASEGLVAEARETQKVVTERLVLRYGEDTGNHLLDRLADTLEAKHKRAEDAVREMHMRELHHFESETALEDVAAERDALRARLTVAEAIISRAKHCVREEFAREQVLAVLNNPLPPLLP